jgi:hypothetical protein
VPTHLDPESGVAPRFAGKTVVVAKIGHYLGFADTRVCALPGFTSWKVNSHCRSECASV